jgi:hypothetical protein
MKTCIKSQLWIPLFFVLGNATAQSRIVFCQTDYGHVPSRYELALLFATGQKESADFIKEYPFNVNVSTSDLDNSWKTATDSLAVEIVNTQLKDIYNIQAYDIYSGQKKKSYSLYYMPTYKEINVALPKAQQVLNYFLTLGSSLYVSSLQSGH